MQGPCLCAGIYSNIRGGWNIQSSIGVDSKAKQWLAARSLFHAEAGAWEGSGKKLQTGSSLQPAQGTRPSNHDNGSGRWLDLFQGLCFLSGPGPVQNEFVFKMLLMCVCGLVGREGTKIRAGRGGRKLEDKFIFKNEPEDQRLDLASLCPVPLLLVSTKTRPPARTRKLHL